MKGRVKVIWRSLLLVLLTLVVVLIPVTVRAIVPASNEVIQQFVDATQQLLDLIPIPSSGLQPEDHLPSDRPRLPQPVNVPQARNSPQFVPQQQVVQIDPSNYDPRETTDLYGNRINNEFIAVLHETVGSATSAINTFRNNHTSEADQVSYHALVTREGTVVYLVPPEMRAFGAGNSVFVGRNGEETVRLHPVFPVSVNNFAYHASLESPPDGRGNGASHSGYTDAQYRSLAWLIAQSDISRDRITTHRAVDRSGSRRDPRSFDMERFLALVDQFRAEGG
mgnify:CR=1 FL=1